MKLKLDENLGKPLAALFQAAGHEAATVPDQKLCGATDFDLIDRCREEKRAIVTLDLDFGNPLLFRPSEYRGIAVLRVSKRASFNELQVLAKTLIEGLAKEELDHKLWVVELGRIRVYQEEHAE